MFVLVLISSCSKKNNPTPVVSMTPSVTTSAISAITTTTATSGGNVTSDGGALVTARGVCWATSANPTFGNVGQFAGVLQRSQLPVSGTAPCTPAMPISTVITPLREMGIPFVA